MSEEITNTLRQLDRFADVSVPVDVRIAARNATVQEIIGLSPGSILLLDKPAGESLDLMIGNLRLASVEVVVVDEKLAVRVTERRSRTRLQEGRSKR